MPPRSLAILCVAGLASRAAAQDTSPNLHRFVKWYSGTASNAWKVRSPTAASDHFSVDFGSSLDGKSLTAFLADAAEFGGVPGTVNLSVVENCAPGVPNLSAALTSRTGSVLAFDRLGTDNAYSLACVAASSPGFGYSAAVTFPAGDSHVWLGSDSAGGSGTTSYFTTTSYAGCTAIPFSGVDLHVGVGVVPEVGLMVNGGSVAKVDSGGGDLCIVFYGPAHQTPGRLFVIAPMVFPVGSFTTDTTNFPGPCPNSWALCRTLQCEVPPPLTLELGHYYLDLTDLHPSGKPKLKLSQATLEVTGLCDYTHWGQRDDCVLDSNIWRATNPAGPSDWFHVNQGVKIPPVNNLTGIEASSWDFCGTGPSWAEVGVYLSNYALDPSGCTPDVSNPVASVGGANATLPPGVGDWGCPMTFYDTPDVVASFGTVYHTAVHWSQGDSCIWLGSDTDGTDSGLGTRIPNNGCCSLFSTDAYSTSALRFTAANWMMQLKWN